MTVGAVNRYTSWSQDAVVITIDPKFSWLAPKFFGTIKQFDGEFVEHDIVEHGRRIAPFVSPMALGVATRGVGMRTFQMKPSYIKLLDTVRPGEGFTRTAGEKYGGSLSPMQRLQRAVKEKIETHEEMIETRWEAMAAEVLFTGMLVITSEQYPTAVVDFERDPNLSLTVATLWTNVASDPMADIQTMAQRINVSSRGAVANTVVMRSERFDNLMANTKFRESLSKLTNLSANQNQGFEATGLRSSDKMPTYRGLLGGQYHVWTYDGYYESDTGLSIPFVPENKVLMLSDKGVDGRRYHGAIQDMDAKMAPAEVFTKQRDLWNPSGKEVLTQSAPMLGLRRPNASGVLTVS